MIKKKLKWFFFGFLISIWTGAIFYNGIYCMARAFTADKPWLSILMFVLGIVNMTMFVVEAISIGKNSEQSELYEKEKGDNR